MRIDRTGVFGIAILAFMGWVGLILVVRTTTTITKPPICFTTTPDSVEFDRDVAISAQLLAIDARFGTYQIHSPVPSVPPKCVVSKVTDNLGLLIPKYGSLDWADCLVYDFQVIDGALAREKR
jgi:hypothetical protein